MIPLLLRLDHIIEHNVSIDRLVESKRALHSVINSIIDPVAESLGLNHGQAFDAVTSLASMMLGTSRVNEGPDLADEELPADVRALIDSFSGDARFVTNACRILAGIRLEP